MVRVRSLGCLVSCYLACDVRFVVLCCGLARLVLLLHGFMHLVSLDLPVLGEDACTFGEVHVVSWVEFSLYRYMNDSVPVVSIISEEQLGISRA